MRRQREAGDAVDPRRLDVGVENPCPDGEQRQRDRPGRPVGDVAEAAVRLQEVERVTQRVGCESDAGQGEEGPVTLGQGLERANAEREQQDVPQGIDQVRDRGQPAVAADLDHRVHDEGGGDVLPPRARR